MASGGFEDLPPPAATGSKIEKGERRKKGEKKSFVVASLLLSTPFFHKKKKKKIYLAAPATKAFCATLAHFSYAATSPAHFNGSATLAS